MRGRNVDKRNFGLDIIRSSAILLVLSGHTVQVLMPYLKGILHLLAGAFVCITGIYGVELFFVLSGFLIGQIIIKEYKKDNFNYLNIKTFYIRRWYRTLPLYYLFLIIYLFAFVFFHYQAINFNSILPIFFSYFIFLQNFFFDMLKGFNEPFNLYGQSWSLAIEEWFYLLLPCLFYSYKIRNLNILKLYKNIALAILFFLLLRIIIAAHFNNLGLQNIDFFIFIRFDSLLIGVLFACLKINNKEIYTKFLKKNFIFLSFAIIVFLSLYLLNVLLFENINQNFFLKTHLWTLLSFASVLLIINIENNIFINKKLIEFKFLKDFFTKISLYSYSIYLSHCILLTIGIQKFYINNSVLWINILLTILFIYITSSLLYRLFEKPIMDLRENYSYDNLEKKRNENLWIK